MVRLSSPISSRLILSGSYAAIAGILLYGIVYSFGGSHQEYEGATYLTKDEDFAFDFTILWLQALGPVFGVFVISLPFFPFTFAYASFVCPSRITITDTEIRAKFFGKEKCWPMSELRSIDFKTVNNSQFIIFKVGGTTLKAEVEHGRWGAIRDLVPLEIAAKV
ncbi:hypothetical protein [Pelagicoccus sp. SDUM812002]|uniref:hypothetical protein n=1 Tax=Pelagicoccus sp. SDUM812002 TaxID=3041266 RepID=UPI00280E7310|nr:hypothetical protein [Pelagicoccus sp. SDUM812002]MDQ8187731.1 hypothetical protein [Pelagicoccus sp. SDUM812002]